MKSVLEKDRIVSIEGDEFQETLEPDQATHVFIWFDRKPMICDYHGDHKEYCVGNQVMHISHPDKLSNRVIAFVKKLHNQKIEK